MWQVGQRIGDYELTADLRSGGMATLFLGRRLGAAGFQRDVAIKIIHPRLADDEQFRQMFLDEAMLSSRIQHPNVVHVEELGEHEGSHYLVMEYVHGCSLSQLQRALVGRGRRLAPAFAARIAMHVADALHAAHETRDEHGRMLNVVHRDVSPENVLIAYAGHVKLIDFGIAKAYGRRHRTQDGLLKGKFRYMAPEQAYSKEIDRRTDIYQLGIVLWEMLTLRRLFDAEDEVDLLQQVREPRIVAPSSLVARIPPALDAVVLSALDPNPKRRPPDAQTFARMLGKAIPEAHEVDSGALSSLVVATMQEHRALEKGTFPPQIYQRLEAEVHTERMAGAAEPARDPALGKSTVEHTAPCGSDAGQGTPLSGSPQAQPRPQQVTAAAYGAPESKAPDADKATPRRRRFVRIASEIKTTITRIADGNLGASRLFWLIVGAAIGLSGVAALVTLALRSRPAPPPSLPAHQAQAMPTAVSPELAPTPSPSPTPTSALAPFAPPPGTPLDVAAPTVHSAEHRPSGEPMPHPPPSDRLSPPVKVDGTPLLLEPGF